MRIYKLVFETAAIQIKWLFAFVMILSLAACKKEFGDANQKSCEGKSYSFQNDIKPIFSNHCLS
jgi:hypothetical protein